MSVNKVIVVFTAKTIERLLREGGTSSWRLDKNHARQCQYAVCTRNAKDEFDDGSGPEEHQSAFLVGKVKNVVPSPDSEGRFLVLFSEYALAAVPEVWKGDRNPVRYATNLEELGIDESKLKWKKMPATANIFDADLTSEGSASPQPGDERTPLSLAEAKRGLALTFGVSPEAIEITIRG